MLCSSIKLCCKIIPERSSLEMKFEILKTISNENFYSYSYIEKQVNSFWNSIKAQCEELEVFEAITIEDSKVKITSKGLEILEKLEKRFNCR
jgi:predicted transcriptional regulator